MWAPENEPPRRRGRQERRSPRRPWRLGGSFLSAVLGALGASAVHLSRQTSAALGALGAWAVLSTANLTLVCGRFTLTVPSYEDLAEALGVEPPPGMELAYKPRFNI